MNEEDEAFNEIERMSNVRKEILRSLNRKRQIQDAEYRDMIKEAVLAEREACAKECWKQMGLLPTQAWTVNPYEQCIDAIRARGQGPTCNVGIKTSNQRIEFSADEGFGTWLINPLKTVDGSTVGECNRASLHRRLDAWLDGTWRETT